MPTIGLTGNFGMGKSTVLDLFGEFDAYTFSIDDFVKKILKDPGTIRKISHAFGEIVLERGRRLSINKAIVARLVFNNPGKRKILEEIIHPQVLRFIKSTRAKVLKRHPSALIIFEVPLLFEAGYENLFDITIVVSCKQATAINRLVKKGFSRDEALKRMRAQMPIAKKKKLADFVINNDAGLGNTRGQVRHIIHKLKQPLSH